MQAVIDELGRFVSGCEVAERAGPGVRAAGCIPMVIDGAWNLARFRVNQEVANAVEAVEAVAAEANEALEELRNGKYSMVTRRCVEGLRPLPVEAPR